jgi:plastocyanin
VARLVLLLGLVLWAGVLSAQKPQVVRLTRSSDGTVYRFAPGRLTVKPGDVIEFRAEAGAPYAIAFEPADLDARSRSLIAAALSRPRGELRSPVLPDSGSKFRMTIPALSPGSYRFFELTHMSYRMAGLLIVESP